jgi:spermidine synthase
MLYGLLDLSLWGYIIAAKRQFSPPSRIPAGLRFVSLDAIKGMFYFPDDMKVGEGEINKLNNQVLVRLFEEEWAGYVN